MSIFDELRRAMGGNRNISIDEVEEMFGDYYKKEQERMGKFNVLILGKTGVGKSTLINSVFGEDIAKTGVGEPVTQHLQRYEKSGLPMVLFDTKGFELCEATQNEIKADMENLLNVYKRTGKEDDCIHFVWYCINTQGRRIEEFEKGIISDFAEKHKIPVILVLTQNYGEAARELRQYMPSDIKAVSYVEVLAKSMIIDEVDNTFIKEKGLTNLIDATMMILPDSRKNAFVKAQKVNVELKRARARMEVNGFIAANAAVGFIPLPFADAPLMVGLEVAMISRVAVIFSSDFEEVSKSVIPALLGVGGVGGAAIVGREIVSNLIKMIPGVGWVAGGMISAATAALLTGTLGYAYIEVMCSIEENKIKTGRKYTDKEFVEMLKNAFADAIKNKKSTVNS